MLDLVFKQAGDSEPGFTRKTVKWAIACTGDGRFIGVIPLDEGKGRVFERCPNLSQPELVGGDGARAHFLAESLPTVALYLDAKAGDQDREKYRLKQAFFVRLLEQMAESAPYLKGAALLLADEENLPSIHAELSRQKAKSTETATFLIDGVNPLERNDWHSAWRTFRQSLHGDKKGKGAKARCLLTGEWIEPAATHPKIKGLAGVGGLGTGDVLIGFDKTAFQSYGLEQSANASMSEESATAYTETLNRLIADKSIKLGNTLSVYWYTDNVPVEDDPLAWLQESSESTAAGAELKARQLLLAVREGQRSDLVGNRYVALLLSGQSGRVMVREVMQGSFEVLAANVEAWFAALNVIARDGKSLIPPPKFLAVAGCLVRDLKDLPSPWLQQLWRAAIDGGAIPHAALAQATMRARIDVIANHPASHARMALLKAYHLRNGDLHMQAYLNPDHPHPAYHCGRLLAVFARLQRAALGDVGAGVVQRYYAAASQTPGLVLGRLAANAKNHLGKLEGGLAWWYENQIAEVMSRIRDSIPGTLTLEEQSLFALGYYQQLAALNAGKGSGKAEPDTARHSNDPADGHKE